MWNRKYMALALAAVAGCLIAAVIGMMSFASAADVATSDLDNQKVYPFRSMNKGSVFLFLSSDCPISNRYAPEIERLQAEFGGKGMAFWTVYPNTDESPEKIRKHTQEYFHNVHVLRDPQHALVKISQVKVTPEAAVFLPNGKLIYHGRIDDRNVDFGVERQQTTRHDLEEVLTALAEGRQITPASTTAVGCYISGLP